MTIDRFLRRGQFPILSERPLDETETKNPSSGKVFVVEVGAYSDRYIDAIFTTRELAEAWVADRQRRAFERDAEKGHQEVAGWTFTSVPPGANEFHGDGRVLADGVEVAQGEPHYRDVPPETFEQFVARHTWNEFGDVQEYDLWDVLPVVNPK
jgi:hypothetical protein